MNSSVKKLMAFVALCITTTNQCVLAAPEEWRTNIDKARELIKENKPVDAEMLLRTTLSQVQKTKHDQMYGRYMGLLGNSLFIQNKNKDMIPFAEDALKTFYALPPDQWPQQTVFFSNHSDLGISYQMQGKLKQAEYQYYKAINWATKMKPGEYNRDWLKTCFDNLVFCLGAEKKLDEQKKAKDQMKKMLG
jgi:hypothetical protein